jgi:hypothetical protein
VVLELASGRVLPLGRRDDEFFCSVVVPLEACRVLFAVDVVTSVSIGSAVVAGIVALFGVLGYQNRRARLSTVRSAFDDVVGALASDDKERQLAAAVLLRRFFDQSSEFAVRDLLGRRRSPYATEAVSVIAAALRGMPSGDLQKLLADGLAYARTLEGADLQRTTFRVRISRRDSNTEPLSERISIGLTSAERR